MPCWVNVQDGVLRDADVPDLRRFSGALLICGWQPPAATLALLDRSGVPVRCWRVTQDARAWPGGIAPLIARCPLALFGNEPDLEGWPSWYQAALGAWREAGGQLVEPALSDESKYAASLAERQEEALVLGTQRGYDAVSAHVYPLGLGRTNLAAVRARAYGRPLVVSEFGIAGHQDQALVQLAALGVTEPAAIYTYRAADAQARPEYDVAGIALFPPPVPPAPPSPSGASKGSPVPDFSPRTPIAYRQAQGTFDCHARNIQRFLSRYGILVDLDTVYQAETGAARPAPSGAAMDFPAVEQAIKVLAQAAGVEVGVDAAAYQPGHAYLQLIELPTEAEVSAALDDPDTANPWTVIAGVAEATLQPGQAYGHFLTLRRWADASKAAVSVHDPLDGFDGDATDTYPWPLLASAMKRSWAKIDALAVKIVVK